MVWIKMCGVWLLADCIYSVFSYPSESWVKCHSIRIVRGIIGLAMMFFT